MIEHDVEVVVFVALMAEARALIGHWRLRLIAGSSPFAIYQNGSKALVVTGMGKANMAAALGYSLSVLPNQNPILLNLGIAGHPQHSLGSWWLAHKITDAETGKSWYPPMSLMAQMPSSALMSFSRPHDTYQFDTLYDMEASAYYEIACKFSNLELIQSIKLVSDNRQQSIASITPQQVTDWISDKIPEIEYVLSALQRAKDSIPAIAQEPYQTLIKQWHFSVSNAVRLRQLLQTWRLMTGEDFNWQACEAKSAKHLLKCLEQALDAMEFRL